MREVIDHRLVRRIDWRLLAFVAAILAISWPTIYSAMLGFDSTAAWHYAQRQLLYAAIGAVFMVLVNTIDHHQLAGLSRPIYWASVLFLVVVLVVGREVNGAKSWLGVGMFRLQPSEFAKIAVIIALARLFSEAETDAGEWRTLFQSAAVLAAPLLLILAQPDLGTSLTFIAVWLVLLWWAGARWWQLALIVMLGLAAFALMWKLDILADYQKSRITVLFDPGADPRGQGYNLRQSLIAVGSGGWSGQGWLQGTQTHLRFLPERHTDFIFAVLCEEWGFVGAITLLLLYLGLVWRGLLIVLRADSSFGRLVALGCVTVILLHVLLNVGMVIGLLPITGLPLPFFSYGGSNLLTSLVLVGLLLNVGMRRGGINF
ncbi:MAG: rod shape-determining protein RodA [Armatimonadetes bacterium]|nr:rod shape-determining protein RodA [Armatimonadota bacterium]